MWKKEPNRGEDEEIAKDKTHELVGMSWIIWMIYNHRQTTIFIGIERLYGLDEGHF